MKGFSRRSFFHGSLGAGLGALTLPAWFPRMAFAEEPDGVAGDTLVCIFQRGGSDGLNVVVPFAESRYHDARPTIGLGDPGSGEGSPLDLDGFFGLHPAMEPLVELYQDGVLAPIHAIGQPENNRSHFDAMDAMERGTPGDKSTADGWIGRHLATVATENDSPFRAISLGAMVPASLRGPVPATALESIADFHLPGGGQTEIESFQATLAALYGGMHAVGAAGLQTFDAIAQLEAANPSQHEPANGAVYPESPFGLGMLQIAQMVKAEVGLEVASIDLGGWDTHESQGGAEGRQSGLLADLSAGLHAFYTDLLDRMGSITVVVLSEFGRRLAENASAGTDHGDGNVMFLLGGSVAGGTVHGLWPGLEPGQLSGTGDLAATTDFRTVLAEVVERRLGNDALGDVFPGFDVPAYLGVVT